MSVYRTTVDVLIVVEDGYDPGPYLADAMTAILTEQMRKYAGPHSCLLDWKYHEPEPGAIGRMNKIQCDPTTYDPDNDPWPTNGRPTLEPLITP